MDGKLARRSQTRSLLRIGSTLLLAVLAFAMSATGALARHANVEIVSQAGAPAGPIPPDTQYFTTIQAAVDAAHRNDWVLVEPGVYDEEVRVTHEHGGIHIRGLNRNTVILDGQHKQVPGGSNGIEVEKANNVWIENLTVRNFDRYGNAEGPGGNQIWWNGGFESGHIGAHGWYGSYLTAYDTGLLGAYGIFTSNSVTGSWENVYASGFDDSGIYLGACQECKAHISGATIENDAVGYSGSNSGGELTIENSTFRHNSVGISPTSENPGDPPPPQDGECHRHNQAHPNPTPHFTSTNIERCEIIRHNLITENGNLSVPADEATIRAPYGAGLLLPGDYADLVEGNTITDNPTNGILAFEFPNPFPPEESTIFFQLAGDKIANNTFSGNGYEGGAFSGDLTMQGGIFGNGRSQSTMDCASGNTFADAVYPANIEDTWGCQNATTPPPNNGFAAIEYILELQAISENVRHPEPQPPAPAQPTMPNPCQGVPVNPLCNGEEGGGWARRR
jgi:Protein of unknown function (DUF1565)